MSGRMMEGENLIRVLVDPVKMQKFRDWQRKKEASVGVVAATRPVTTGRVSADSKSDSSDREEAGQASQRGVHGRHMMEASASCSAQGEEQAGSLPTQPQAKDSSVAKGPKMEAEVGRISPHPAGHRNSCRGKSILDDDAGGQAGPASKKWKLSIEKGEATAEADLKTILEELSHHAGRIAALVSSLHERFGMNLDELLLIAYSAERMDAYGLKNFVKID